MYPCLCYLNSRILDNKFRSFKKTENLFYLFIYLFVLYRGQYIKPQDVEVQLNCITV